MNKNQSKLQNTFSLFVEIRIWIDFYARVKQKKMTFNLGSLYHVSLLTSNLERSLWIGQFCSAPSEYKNQYE